MENNKKPKYIQAPTVDDLKRMENGEKFSDITSGPLKKTFDNALDDDLTEITQYDESDEVVIHSHSRGFRRKFFYVLGLVMTVMSIIGFIFTINFVKGVIHNIVDNTQQKEMFEDYILPLVVCDVPVYDTNHHLANETILMAAAWDVILNGDTSKYVENFGEITVPAIDIETHAVKLFGRGLQFEHMTLGDAELSFYYNEETNSYILPLKPNYTPYIPKVDEIEKVGETYTLTVSYYSLWTSWIPSNTKYEADKVMSYTVVKRGNNYSVTSVKEISFNSGDL